ncbi:MAG: hypothetical protein IK130_08450 [Oscillospiraceae bacterium]|nr:hypothetical protein [Oscillospiraceae bacterium]
MEQHKQDITRSVIAIGLCIVFLWTGKKFIWNQSDPETVPASETDPNITEIYANTSDATGLPIDSDPTHSDPASTDVTAPASDYVLPDGSTSFTALSFPVTQSETLPGTTTSLANAGNITSTTTSVSSSLANGQVSTTTTTSSATTSSTSTTSQTTVSTTKAAAAQPGFGPAPAGYFNDALFIGDSRMVGVVSYAKFDSAAYFATVGLSTYNLDKSKSEIEENKGQTLSQILAARKFGKVYINMGINEIGMDLNKTITNYQNLIQRVRDASPGCLIYLEANLRVTAAKSKSDKTINNTKINKFNDALKNLCNGSDIVYLDVNPVFDDGTGALDKKYTGDNVHPKATYYKQWAQWLKDNVKQ